MLIAQWTGQVKRTRNIRGNPGYCQLEYLNLRTKKSYMFDITKLKHFDIEDFQCDLTFGRLFCKGSEQNILEMFTVSLSATVLYLLVQPIPGDSVEDVQAKWDALHPRQRRVMEEPPVLTNSSSELIKCCGKVYFDNLYLEKALN